MKLFADRDLVGRTVINTVQFCSFNISSVHTLFTASLLLDSGRWGEEEEL